MQSNINRYSAATAKVKVMKSHLLQKHDYNELLSKPCVSDIAVYLKHSTEYGQDMAELSEHTVHRSELERMLRHASERGFERLCHFLQHSDKRFLRIYVLESEIRFIKQIIRITLLNKLTVSDITSNKYYLKYYSFNPHKLAAAKTITEFCDALRDTEYCNILQPFIHSDSDVDLFMTEMALDVYFYKTLWRTVKKQLSGKEQTLVKRTFGSELDMLNIMWIVRCKKSFDVPKEIIYSFILSHRYRLSKAQLVNMVEAENIEQITDQLGKTPYSRLLGGDSEYFEQIYQEISSGILHKSARFNDFSIIQVLRYLRLKDIEIGNLVRIIEAVRYEVDREEIGKYLRL